MHLSLHVVIHIYIYTEVTTMAFRGLGLWRSDVSFPSCFLVGFVVWVSRLVQGVRGLPHSQKTGSEVSNAARFISKPWCMDHVLSRSEVVNTSQGQEQLKMT